MDLGLQGKKAIVVGAARGIGMAVAETLAREGCDLAIAARSEDGVKDAVASLKRYGTNVIGKAVNVKKADDYKDWLNWAIDALDGCDVLIPISSAGGGLGSEKYWHNAFEVDVMGPVRAVEAVLPRMVEQKSGSIVLIATTSAGEAMGGPVSETYSAPLGGRITGHFVASDGKGGVSFTELVDYVPVGRSIAYRVRHFGPDMKGWEDKTGKPVVVPLVAVEGSRWYFDGMTLDRTAPDALTMWVRIEDGGKATDVPFRLVRAAR